MIAERCHRNLDFKALGIQLATRKVEHMARAGAEFATRGHV